MEHLGIGIFNVYGGISSFQIPKGVKYYGQNEQVYIHDIYYILH